MTVDNKAPKTALKVVLGTMTLGKEGAPRARVTDINDCAAMVNTFQQHGHSEVDCARMYGGGTSEEVLAKLEWRHRGMVVGTKVNPMQYAHKKDTLQAGLAASLQALDTDEVDLWYLHVPDRKTSYIETLEAVNELYRAGKFKRFGICNYPAWEVTQICEICERNGWKKPDVYQGVYHALQRAIEPELFPCLRHYGIAFYNFSPLAGGLLTDRYQRDTTEHEKGSRFDPNGVRGVNFFRKQYWNDEYFDALDIIRPIAKELGMTTAEASVRWLVHHSAMKEDKGDAVVVGASSPAQLEENLQNLEGDPLPETMVAAFEEAWKKIKGVCPVYYQ